MAAYPKEITVKLRVYENGKIEVLEKQGTPLDDLKQGRVIKGHNAIGVLVSNPTCFIVDGQMFCY